VEAAAPLITLAKGFAVGIVIALPVGPVGMLCVRRTLFEGLSFGLASGLGATCADSIFGIIAGLGLGIVRDWLLSVQDWLGAGGGLFLLYSGARALAAAPKIMAEPLTGERLAGAFASAFALTLSNPVSILGFTAIFAKVGIDPAASYGGIAVLVAGVFAGSACWWLGISTGVSLVRRRAPAWGLRAISRISGAILLLSGLGLLGVAGLGLVRARL
jgi:threonine/homoserine/homoserine lactone efflux protein